MDLAVVACELAYLLAASDAAAAETVAREALKGLAKLADHQPPIPSYVNALGCAYYEMAQLFMMLKNNGLQRPLGDRAVNSLPSRSAGP